MLCNTKTELNPNLAPAIPPITGPKTIPILCTPPNVAKTLPLLLTGTKWATYDIREILQRAIAPPTKNLNIKNIEKLSLVIINNGKNIINSVPKSIDLFLPCLLISKPTGISKNIFPIKTAEIPNPTKPTPTPNSLIKLGKIGINKEMLKVKRKLGK